MTRYTEQQIGEWLHDLITDHIVASADANLPAIAIEGFEPVVDLGLETPEGDYSNLLLSLPDGSCFRVQVFAHQSVAS